MLSTATKNSHKAEAWNLRCGPDLAATMFSSSDTVPRGYSNKRGTLVYVVQNPVSHLVKIGISTNPSERMQTLETNCGCRFDRIFLSLPFRNPKFVEQAMHRLFHKNRTVGEWFSIPFDEPVGVLLYLEQMTDADRILPFDAPIDALCQRKLNVVRRSATQCYTTVCCTISGRDTWNISS